MKSFSSASASGGRFTSAAASCSRSFWKREGGLDSDDEVEEDDWWTWWWKGATEICPSWTCKRLASVPSISLLFPLPLFFRVFLFINLYLSLSLTVSVCLICSIFEHEIQIARDGGGFGGMRTTLENYFILRSCGFVPSDGDQWIPWLWFSALGALCCVLRKLFYL